MTTWPRPLGDAALHGPAGEFVQRVEPHTEADPAALLVQLLVAFGAAAGRHSYIGVEASRHYPNEFCVLVGATGKGRKGSSWDHVAAVVGETDASFAERRVVSGLSSGEGLIAEVRDAVDEHDTAAPEDKRLLVVEPEFAQVMKVLAREGNTLSPVVRNAWDGKRLQTLVRNSPLRASGAHVAIVAHITKDELLRYLNATELANGFFNRFLLVAVRRSQAPAVRRLPERRRPRHASAGTPCRVERRPTGARAGFHRRSPRAATRRSTSSYQPRSRACSAPRRDEPKHTRSDWRFSTRSWTTPSRSTFPTSTPRWNCGATHATAATGCSATVSATPRPTTSGRSRNSDLRVLPGPTSGTCSAATRRPARSTAHSPSSRTPADSFGPPSATVAVAPPRPGSQPLGKPRDSRRSSHDRVVSAPAAQTPRSGSQIMAHVAPRRAVETSTTDCVLRRRCPVVCRGANADWAVIARLLLGGSVGGPRCCPSGARYTSISVDGYRARQADG